MDHWKEKQQTTKLQKLFMSQIFSNSLPGHDGRRQQNYLCHRCSLTVYQVMMADDSNTCDLMTSTLPLGTPGSIVSLSNETR